MRRTLAGVLLVALSCLVPIRTEAGTVVLGSPETISTGADAPLTGNASRQLYRLDSTTKHAFQFVTASNNWGVQYHFRWPQDNPTSVNLYLYALGCQAADLEAGCTAVDLTMRKACIHTDIGCGDSVTGMTWSGLQSNSYALLNTNWAATGPATHTFGTAPGAGTPCVALAFRGDVESSPCQDCGISVFSCIGSGNPCTCCTGAGTGTCSGLNYLLWRGAYIEY